jgi:hypothetical protein
VGNIREPLMAKMVLDLQKSFITFFDSHAIYSIVNLANKKWRGRRQSLARGMSFSPEQHSSETRIESCPKAKYKQKGRVELNS